MDSFLLLTLLCLLLSGCGYQQTGTLDTSLFAVPEWVRFECGEVDSEEYLAATATDAETATSLWTALDFGQWQEMELTALPEAGDGDIRLYFSDIPFAQRSAAINDHCLRINLAADDTAIVAYPFQYEISDLNHGSLYYKMTGYALPAGSYNNVLSCFEYLRKDMETFADGGTTELADSGVDCPVLFLRPEGFPYFEQSHSDGYWQGIWSDQKGNGAGIGPGIYGDEVDGQAVIVFGVRPKEAGTYDAYGMENSNGLAIRGIGGEAQPLFVSGYPAVCYHGACSATMPNFTQDQEPTISSYLLSWNDEQYFYELWVDMLASAADDSYLQMLKDMAESVQWK